MPDTLLIDQTAMPLVEALQTCVQAATAPFYAPGHKHGRGIGSLSDLFGSQVFRADLPELPELDNLFAPQGAIAQAQALAAAAFGAEQTWFLANGSTSGIVAAILATCNPGDKIILPRNGHQAAIAGLVLSGAVPIFLQPEYDSELDIAHSITPASLAAALQQHPDAKAVMLLYPTYYGACGDVRAIAQLTHEQGIPLLVDEAHGAHFAFHAQFPVSALAAGADLTVQSTHKTLTALTQAAMLHIQGDRVSADRVRRSLQLVQSTSPSYLLLASLDAARQQMATQGNSLMQRTLELADNVRSRLSQLGLRVLQAPATPGFVALDRTRITVTVSDWGLTGFAADEILHTQLGVTAELPSLQHLTFILSLGNTVTDGDRLVKAFAQLRQGKHEPRSQSAPIQLPDSTSALTPRQAFFAATETVPIRQAVDRISAELICPYPPGIPVLMPGEVITEAAIGLLHHVLQAGGMISGCADPAIETLLVARV